MSVRILDGDCRALLASLDAGSVQTCVTSPPYWGLRDYGHEGQLGLERTPDEYVANMVDVFRAVRRVLADDGTLWLNLGDCYATGAGKVGEHPGGGEQGARWAGRDHHPSRVQKGTGRQLGPMTQPNRMPIPGLKPKDLVMIPARVAIALQADGWWVRSDVIWHKPNPMPESTRDRPTKAHEYLYLLTKAERYYYDADAIAEDAAPESASRYGYAFGGAKAEHLTAEEANGPGTRTRPIGERTFTGKRNRRTVWTVPTQPYSGAHFATFPPALIEPCILAGSRRGDTVLDPFGGAGTTGLVADRLGRDAILCELNPEYAAMARARILAGSPLFGDVA